MARFRRVAVLMGGVSEEREVSLRSGAAVTRGLQAAGYEAAAVDVTGPDVAVPAGTEAAFIALHGRFGEDGGVQALLDARGLPYTGSGAAASRAAFDKIVSKRIFGARGIPTPACEVVRNGCARKLPLPVVVKPPRQGSSVGITRVRTEADWGRALDAARPFGDEILVEEYIAGRELTVGVVGERVLPAVEITAPEAWYDYAAKYTAGACRYDVPAALDDATARRCAEVALATFRALGCRGLGRVDIRLTAAGEPYVLELNSIPGFTETSLLPKAAAAAGMPFPALCAAIVELARTG